MWAESVASLSVHIFYAMKYSKQQGLTACIGLRILKL